MKKVILSVLLLGSLIGIAQNGGEHQKRGVHEMTPEQQATLQTKKMTLALDLSEAQQTQLQSYFVKIANERKQRMAARKSDMEKREVKTLTSDERFAQRKEQLDRQIAEKAELKKILSPEQYGSWEGMGHKGRKQRHSDGHKKGKRSSRE